MRRKILVNQARPNPRYFVRADACPNTATTDTQAALHRSGGNRPGHGNDEIRVVIVHFRTVIAEINYLMSGLA